MIEDGIVTCVSPRISYRLCHSGWAIPYVRRHIGGSHQAGVCERGVISVWADLLKTDGRTKRIERTDESGRVGEDHDAADWAYLAPSALQTGQQHRVSKSLHLSMSDMQVLLLQK